MIDNIIMILVSISAIIAWGKLLTNTEEKSSLWLLIPIALLMLFIASIEPHTIIGHLFLLVGIVYSLQSLFKYSRIGKEKDRKKIVELYEIAREIAIEKHWERYIPELNEREQKELQALENLY